MNTGGAVPTMQA